MTALDRANALLNNRAAQLALMVILLGIFAVSAAQAASLPPNLCAVGADPNTCLFTSNLQVTFLPAIAVGDDVCGENGDDDPCPVPTGVNFSASPDAAGGVVVVGGFGLTAAAAGTYSFLLDLNGGTAGIPLGTNGVAGYYDVTITPSAGSGIVGAAALYTVTMQDTTTFGPAQVSVTGPGRGTGNVHLGPIDPTQIVANWDMQVAFDWLADTGDTLVFDDPLTLDPTPEPVSVLLVGSGIGLLALLRRWRKA